MKAPRLIGAATSGLSHDQERDTVRMQEGKRKGDERMGAAETGATDSHVCAW